MSETPEVGTVESTEIVPKEEGAVVETSSTAVAAREKAAVEARFVMAVKRPRVPENARLRVLEACKRPRFAESARYRKPIGGKAIEGLSVRFAEEIGRLWGNLYVVTTVVFDDRERRIYRVSATDLETNMAQDQDVVVEKFVERKKVKSGDEVIGKRTNSYGDTVYMKVATEDEILVKANAAISKARRNLILTLIPSDIREEAEERCVATVRDRDAEDPTAATKRVLDAFYVLGVAADQIVALLGKPMQQINPGDLQLLRSIHTALKEGEVTWAEVMEDKSLGKQRKVNTSKAKGTDAVKERVKKKTAQKTEKKQTEEEIEREAIVDESEEDERARQEESAEVEK